VIASLENLETAEALAHLVRSHRPGPVENTGLIFRENLNVVCRFQVGMEWLNYHHLLYFWCVVRLGGITRACEELRLAPSTVSAQLRSLEDQLGEKLLAHSGRTLVPTEVGSVVYGYAEEIFGLGREMMNSIKKRPTGKPLRLTVGVDDVLPKEIAQRLIAPAFGLSQPVRILCREASLGRLVADLAAHELDVVLSDSPAAPVLNLRTYDHPLGETGIMWMGTPRLVRMYKRGFPKSLDGAPILLPTEDTAIRRQLDHWFSHLGVRPVMVGEFKDYALLREFGQRGTGLFPAHSVLERQFRKQYGLQRLGVAKNVRGCFYAVTAERGLNHPAVRAICASAGKHLQSQNVALVGCAGQELASDAPA
jgi:LysR family transcriptional regulator, transcriptional activator of nhaA